MEKESKLKEIIKLEGDLEDPLFTDMPIFYPIKELKFKGKIVLYQQAYSPKNFPYGVISGFKSSEPYTTKQGFSAIKVQPIENEKDKKIISSLLKDKLKGPINY